MIAVQLRSAFASVLSPGSVFERLRLVLKLVSHVHQDGDGLGIIDRAREADAPSCLLAQLLRIAHGTTRPNYTGNTN